MTIEDQQPSVRCASCGTWIPGSAVSCPSCGAPRPVATYGVAGDPKAARRVRIAVGGLVAAAAIAVVVYLGAAGSNPVGVASPTPGASATASSSAPSSLDPVTRPSSSPVPTPRMGPSSSPAPTSEPTASEPPPPVERGPLIPPGGYADVGSRAVVLSTGLRVRIEAGLDAQVLVQLLSGTQLLIRQGPVPADGFDWYEVLYPALPEESPNRVGNGWVAVGPTGRPPTLVRIDEPRCPPVPPTASLLGSMGGLSRVQCFGADPLEFTAVIDTCYEGPFTPYRYDPDWMRYSCISAFDLGSDAHLDLYFGPSSPGSNDLTRGTVVHLVGHLLDPVATSCRIWTDDPEVQEPSPAMQAYFALLCRSSFVVTELQVVGKIDLPSWFD